MPNFIEIAENETVEDIKDVPPLPVGSYLALVSGPHEMVVSSQQKTDGCQITYRLVQARDDVDIEALGAYLEASNQQLRDVQMRETIWESPYAKTNLRDRLVAMDLGKLPLKQALGEIPGKEVLLTITHRPFTDRGGNARLRAEISGVAKAL